MPILIEGISVVILCHSIVEKMSGGVDYFYKNLPNKTLRSDGDLACLHFMTPHDTKAYVDFLNNSGLTYRDKNGAPIDIIVVDQNRGPMVSCDWLDFGHADWNNNPGQTVAVCRAKFTKNLGLVAPEGWSYENSLTANSRFVAADEIPSNLEFLRHEEGIDILIDRNTGKNFFVRRS
jgi:hypothetical protein